MKLDPWEPDLQSLEQRVKAGDLDLQPDFQRGIAWGPVKQQRLVDTVLRGWAVPAVHLLVQEDGRLAVLDGQQRLHALMEFLGDRLPVHGRLEPIDDRLRSLHGLFFSELDPSLQRHVRNFKIPAYRLYEYRPDEPYELFFRLNLPTGLTPAEKRNALVGDNHAIVRHLVETAVSDHGWDKETIGFSNARLAYDDAIARLCAYIEAGTLRAPMTAAALESVYRSSDPFTETTVEIAEGAVARVGASLSDALPALNKATLITWLLFAARIGLERLPIGLPDQGHVMVAVESNRLAVRRGHRSLLALEFQSRAALSFLEVFNDRASSRVTDTLSVVARDACVWRLAAELLPAAALPREFDVLRTALAAAETSGADMMASILDELDDPGIWGELHAAR